MSLLYFTAEVGKTSVKIPHTDLAKVIIEKRRKLAPLILGGLITSLSLLSIFLYSSRLEIVALVALGLILTYFGTIEYPVLHLEHSSKTTLLWLSSRENINSMRPLVAMLEYHISRNRFPVLYASPLSAQDNRMIHYETNPVKSYDSIIYTFSRTNSNEMIQVAVNPALLDAPINIDGNGKVIGEGGFLINQEAVISENSVSIS